MLTWAQFKNAFRPAQGTERRRLQKSAPSGTPKRSTAPASFLLGSLRRIGELDRLEAVTVPLGVSSKELDVFSGIPASQDQRVMFVKRGRSPEKISAALYDAGGQWAGHNIIERGEPKTGNFDQITARLQNASIANPKTSRSRLQKPLGRKLDVMACRLEERAENAVICGEIRGCIDSLAVVAAVAAKNLAKEAAAPVFDRVVSALQILATKPGISADMLGTINNDVWAIAESGGTRVDIGNIGSLRSEIRERLLAHGVGAETEVSEKTPNSMPNPGAPRPDLSSRQMPRQSNRSVPSSSVPVRSMQQQRFNSGPLIPGESSRQMSR